MKRNLYLLALSLAIFGCQQPKVKKEKDLRPENEILLVNKFKEADSIYSHQINDLRKSEVSDSAKNALSNYIIKDLSLKADSWIATVHEIKLDEELDNVEVKLLIKTTEEPDEKYPEFNSIVLIGNANYKSKNLVNALRTIKINDKVMISGRFVKTPTGIIFIMAYGSAEDDLSNPSLTFELTNIKKI